MSIKGNTDSIVVRFHSWIFIQSEESSDANSKLFKEDDDEAMYKNPCEIRLCDLISVSLSIYIPTPAFFKSSAAHDASIRMSSRSVSAKAGESCCFTCSYIAASNAYAQTILPS